MLPVPVVEALYVETSKDREILEGARGLEGGSIQKSLLTQKVIECIYRVKLRGKFTA